MGGWWKREAGTPGGTGQLCNKEEPSTVCQLVSGGDGRGGGRMAPAMPCQKRLMTCHNARCVDLHSMHILKTVLPWLEGKAEEVFNFTML